jgi:hypothetical protein
MPLTLRPTGLGSGIDKDRPDYTVRTGEWEVGWPYQTRGGPDGLCSFPSQLRAPRMSRFIIAILGAYLLAGAHYVRPSLSRGVIRRLSQQEVLDNRQNVNDVALTIYQFD